MVWEFSLFSVLLVPLALFSLSAQEQATKVQQRHVTTNLLRHPLTFLVLILNQESVSPRPPEQTEPLLRPWSAILWADAPHRPLHPTTETPQPGSIVRKRKPRSFFVRDTAKIHRPGPGNLGTERPKIQASDRKGREERQTARTGAGILLIPHHRTCPPLVVLAVWGQWMLLLADTRSKGWFSGATRPRGPVDHGKGWIIWTS